MVKAAKKHHKAQSNVHTYPHTPKQGFNQKSLGARGSARVINRGANNGDERRVRWQRVRGPEAVLQVLGATQLSLRRVVSERMENLAVLGA